MVTKNVIQSAIGLKSEFSRRLDKIPVKILLDAHGLLCTVLVFQGSCNALTSSFIKILKFRHRDVRNVAMATIN